MHNFKVQFKNRSISYKYLIHSILFEKIFIFILNKMLINIQITDMFSMPCLFINRSFDMLS